MLLRFFKEGNRGIEEYGNNIVEILKRGCVVL